MRSPSRSMRTAGEWNLITLPVALTSFAMVTGMVPVVGVPLPFVSYGGTALTTLMAGLGLAMAADVDRNSPLWSPLSRFHPATGERLTAAGAPMAGILGIVPKRVLDRVRLR